MQERIYFLFSIFLFIQFPCFTGGIQLIIANGCKESIWPGILATAGHPTPVAGGFHLRPGTNRFLNLPANWSGRVWGRTGCRFEKHSETGSCFTGDCSGRRKCAGTGGTPPATIAEMTFGTPDSPMHYYDVSLVGGFNLPVSVVPLAAAAGGDQGCGAAACEADLNAVCPAVMAALDERGDVVGCKTACLVSGSPEDCCTGEFGSSEKCRPTVYGRVMKGLCPRAYAFPFDDQESGVRVCRAPRYLLTFCPAN